MAAQDDILPKHKPLIHQARVNFASTPDGEPRYPHVRVEYDVFESACNVPTRYIRITDPEDAYMVCAHLGWDETWAKTRVIALGVPIV
jgi:hypothetical protein